MNDSSTRTTWRRPLALFGLIFLFWTVAALAFTAQLYFSRALSDSPLTLRRVVTEQFIYPYLWAFATPVVLWLARRFPVGQGQWRRSVPLHLLFALAFTVIINGSFHVLYHFLGENAGRPYVFMATVRTIIYNSSEAVGIYAIILLFSHAFNYYRRYREVELRTSQLQAQLAQAQLQALKMQLHPHFLFNTLHSISALIYKDAEAADRMIARLGDFLRLTLENSGTQEVTLRQELEFLKCYLEIERIRFNDRLTTHFDIDEQTLEAPVPNLILQPIVENAIRHGVAARSAPGRIEIQAKRNDDSVRIEVKDNGPGLPENQSANSRLKEGGLGLANTRARLERLYGGTHRFELANAPEGGLVVTMEIPADARPAA